MKVGFLTPDEFAEISDFNAISLSAEYEHWYINSLGRAIRFIRGAQILDAKDEIVEVFSLASYLDTGRTNTAEYAPIFVEKSFHTPDSPQEAATCHAYQITDNGKQTGHGLCWMLVFLDSKNEPSGQFHVFSKASILFPSEPKGMDESYAYCVDFAKKYKLKVQKEKPRALEFCHGHRMMSKMDS